jgi:hypothetical protein
MPGAFGKTNSDDGLHASTRSSAKSGVFGRNDAKKSPPPDTAGGAGVFGLTVAPSAAGVFGASEHASKGVGVQGNGPEAGISGFSETGAGVRAHSSHGDGGALFAHDPNASAVLAINDATATWTATDGAPHGSGACGVTTVPRAAGVFGANNSNSGVGVRGNGAESGLSGYSQTGSGARAFSVLSNGVEGFAEGDSRLGSVLAGVGARARVVDAARRAADSAAEKVRPVSRERLLGLTSDAVSVARDSATDTAAGAGLSEHLQTAVRIAEAGQWLVEAPAGRGSRTSIGVRSPIGSLVGARDVATTDRPKGNGVWGHTKVHLGSGVFGTVEPGLTDAAGVTGVGNIAGQFFGNLVCTASASVGGRMIVGGDVTVGGDVRLTGADLAENFDIAGTVAAADAEPGTVMVIDDDGGLKPSGSAYDTAVAGVVSGAGAYRPGVVLDEHAGRSDRVTVALVGKVHCRVDASHGAVHVGDLLTTSPTPGHAMRAADPSRAFGAIVGKALAPLAAGQGLLPVLVALQ